MRVYLVATTILVCVFLTIETSANAQTKEFARQGIAEIAGNLSFNSLTPVDNGESGSATTLFSLAPQVGYFVSDGFELGLQTGISLLPGITAVSPPEGDGMTLVQFFFAPSYNVILPDAKLYPFIEADLGYTSISSGGNSSTGFSYGARGGLKIPVVDHLLVSTSFQYLAVTLNPENAV